MGVFRQLFGLSKKKDTSDLLPAIERAVTGVEPLLKQMSQYPEAYRKPVMCALDYARELANNVPGPVEIDLDAYAKDAYVHAIFPSMDLVSEAFRTSCVMQDYLREHPSTREVYALMGMRRWEKSTMGMGLTGQVIQRDVPQQVVYFTSHTVENPAQTEQEARDQIAWSFFDSLVAKVAKRVALHKQNMQSQQQEKDILMARLRAANAQTRPAMEAELSSLLSSMQSNSRSLDLHNYQNDFKEVLLHPEQHLRLNQSTMILDSMGIKQDSVEAGQIKPVTFNDLIGYDRRDWTVTMVHCRDMQSESFAARLETAYRRLSI